MGDDGHVDNSGTAWSTPLQEPMTDDERPPPVTPGGEDMELDVTVPKEGDVSLSAVPVQALAHIPAPIPGVSVLLQLLRRLDSKFYRLSLRD